MGPQAADDAACSAKRVQLVAELRAQPAHNINDAGLKRDLNRFGTPPEVLLSGHLPRFHNGLIQLLEAHLGLGLQRLQATISRLSS